MIHTHHPAPSQFITFQLRHKAILMMGSNYKIENFSTMTIWKPPTICHLVLCYDAVLAVLGNSTIKIAQKVLLSHIRLLVGII